LPITGRSAYYLALFQRPQADPKRINKTSAGEIRILFRVAFCATDFLLPACFAKS
jgi:hypothetical protein